MEKRISLLLTIFLFSFFLMYPIKAWWNPNYQYRHSSIVLDLDNVNLNEFIYLFNGTSGFNTANLITAGKMRSDCKDLAFVNDTSSELDWNWESYYNATYGCNSPNSKIWIESNIAGANTTNVLAYYGYASETSWHNKTNATESTLWGMWHFEEGSGTSVNSSVTSSMGCTLSGNTNFTGGKYGYGLNFSGVITSSCKLDAIPASGTKFAVSMWIYLKELGSQILFSFWDADGSDYFECSAAITGVVTCYNKVAGTEHYVDSPAVLTTGKWYHIVFQLNSTVGQLFINGTDVSGTNTIGNENLPVLTKGRFGVRANDAESPMRGIIDEVRMWARPLSYAEVKRMYNMELITMGNEEAYPINTINSLSDGSTSKNLTFTGSQNQTVYISLPKYSTILGAKLNLSGYNGTYIYQESANSSYCNNTPWYPPQPCTNAYDGNWNTYAVIGGTNVGYVYENYTKPTNSTSALLIQYKGGESPILSNNSIPTSCWNYNNSILMIRLFSNGSSPISNGIDCYNGSWVNVYTLSGLTAIYEDGIFWSLNIYPTNPFLDVSNDGDTEWSYSGEFNQTNNRTSDFSSEMNNYLWNCFPINGSCLVPLVLHSDTAGILQISDINVTYNPNYIYQVDYPSSVLSGGSDTISLQIKNSSVINNATLIWNGTSYSNNVTNLGDMWTYSSTFTAPAVPSNTNASFYWNFYINGTQRNTSSYNQTILFVGIDNCSSYTTKAMTFTIYNESTLTTMYGTLELVFDIYLNPTTVTTYSTKFQNNYTYSVCLNLNTTNYTFDGYMTFYNNSGYNPRTYWFYHASLNNVTQNVSLYLITTGESQVITFTVREESGYPKPDIYTVIQRFFPSLNSYTTIQIGKSDSNGQLVAYLIPYTAYYKILLMQSGQLIQTINPFLITSNSISLNINTTFGMYLYKYYGKIAYSCTYNNVTGYFTCIITDTSGEMTKCYLDIMTVNTTNNEQVCSTNGVSSSMTIGCYLGNTTGKNYFYSLYCDLREGKTILEKDFLSGGSMAIIPTIPIYGLEGVFLTFMITGTMSFIGLNINPSLGILLLFVAMFGCMAFGLIALIPGVVVAMLLGGIIIMYWVETL